MKLKVTSALAAGLLLAACQSSQQGTDKSMADASAIPGSMEDFQRNVPNKAYFGYDSSSLNGEAQGNLTQVANWSRQYPQTPLIVEGNCDPRGTREYNLALGEKRAKSAANYLTANGAVGGNGSQYIRTVSYGKDRLPAGPGNDEATYAKNRVAIVNPE